MCLGGNRELEGTIRIRRRGNGERFQVPAGDVDCGRVHGRGKAIGAVAQDRALGQATDGNQTERVASIGDRGGDIERDSRVFRAGRIGRIQVRRRRAVIVHDGRHHHGMIDVDDAEALAVLIGRGARIEQLGTERLVLFGAVVAGDIGGDDRFGFSGRNHDPAGHRIEVAGPTSARDRQVSSRLLAPHTLRAAVDGAVLHVDVLAGRLVERDHIVHRRAPGIALDGRIGGGPVGGRDADHRLARRHLRLDGCQGDRRRAAGLFGGFRTDLELELGNPRRWRYRQRIQLPAFERQRAVCADHRFPTTVADDGALGQAVEEQGERFRPVGIDQRSVDLERQRALAGLLGAVVEERLVGDGRDGDVEAGASQRLGAAVAGIRAQHVDRERQFTGKMRRHCHFKARQLVGRELPDAGAHRFAGRQAGAGRHPVDTDDQRRRIAAGIDQNQQWYRLVFGDAHGQSGQGDLHIAGSGRQGRVRVGVGGLGGGRRQTGRRPDKVARRLRRIAGARNEIGPDAAGDRASTAARDRSGRVGIAKWRRRCCGKRIGKPDGGRFRAGFGRARRYRPLTVRNRIHIARLGPPGFAGADGIAVRSTRSVMQIAQRRVVAGLRIDRLGELDPFLRIPGIPLNPKVGVIRPLIRGFRRLLLIFPAAVLAVFCHLASPSLLPGLNTHRSPDRSWPGPWQETASSRMLKVQFRGVVKAA